MYRNQWGGSVVGMPKDLYFARIGRIAARQDRIATRHQLLSAGVAAATIDRLRTREYLIPVFPGIYLVGVPGLSHREFLRACVLHAGPAAFPSHRSGLELRDVLPVTEGRVTVTTKRRNVATPVYSRTPMTSGSLGILYVKQSISPLALPTERAGGYETTLVPRTLVDLAGMEGAWVLRRAWREAMFRSLLDPDAIERQLKAHTRPGNPLVRERMRAAYPVTRPGMDVRSRSGELAFLELVRELGLPEPLVNHPMTIAGRDYRLDFYWIHLRLAIETDGGQHDEEEHKQDDRTRTMDFFNAEIDVLHVSNEKLKTDRGWCRASVLAAYQRQLRRAA